MKDECEQALREGHTVMRSSPLRRSGRISRCGSSAIAAVVSSTSLDASPSSA
jgi:hypothetical protein